MSYESESYLAKGTRTKDVQEFVCLLGYEPAGMLGKFEEYYWFEQEDYKSWSGVGLWIHRDRTGLCVSTRTSISRSYYDLTHQNYTIASLKKHFGGSFITDEGKGRYLHAEGEPPTPPASGCRLAFSRFGHNLIRASSLHQARQFPEHVAEHATGLGVLDDYNPRLLANNTLIPFIVAGLEDYFKSTFIALLRYSDRKSSFFRKVRLSGDHLTAISNGDATLEGRVAETISFQDINAVCRHFKTLDPQLDLYGLLNRPYRRRKWSFFEMIENLISVRHRIIHRTEMNHALTDSVIEDLIYDLDTAITRAYLALTMIYGWTFDRTWHLGRRL